MDKIDITQNALENIHAMRIEYAEESWGLRFGLTGGGCSGYKYVLEFEEGAQAHDRVFEFPQLKVFVDNEHFEKLKNTVIDWKDSLMESGFDIDNPQAKRPCGCGESFDL